MTDILELPSNETHDLFEHRVRQTDKLDLEFVGRELAPVFDSGDWHNEKFSGIAGESSELTLYQTKGGKFIRSKAEFKQGVSVQRFAHVSDTVQGFVEFFGAGKLAYELYKEADVKVSVEIA